MPSAPENDPTQALVQTIPMIRAAISPSRGSLPHLPGLAAGGLVREPVCQPLPGGARPLSASWTGPDRKPAGHGPGHPFHSGQLPGHAHRDTRRRPKALVLALVVLFAGMLVCPGLSAFTAWLRLRSYPRE